MISDNIGITIQSDCLYFSKKLLTKSPVAGSSDAVGSSRSKTFGLLIIDFARLTLFF